MVAAEEVLRGALELPVGDRARVAAALLASLDESEDWDAESAWSAEIERRAQRALADDSSGSPWDEARTRLLARLERR